MQSNRLKENSLATFRRKIGISERPALPVVFWGAPVMLSDSRCPQDEAGDPDHVRAASTLPMLISVSAITPALPNASSLPLRDSDSDSVHVAVSAH